MGILKDAGESFLKYSEIVVNRTEKLTKIAKLKLDIKKIEYEIDRVYKTAGSHLYAASQSGASSLDMNEPAVKEFCDKITDLKKNIEIKNSGIDEIKNAVSE
jgi:uncharacterized protein Yka (UPF0111/DUF47 family)